MPAESDLFAKKLPDRIIFMSVFNDIELDRHSIEEGCANARKFTTLSKDFKPMYWRFIDTQNQTKGRWNSIASRQTDIFA